MKLAEQSANGVYASAQREALQQEAAALVDEHNRILSSTSYNNMRLLDGSSSTYKLQAFVTTFDFNQDGNDDFAVSSSGSSNVSLYLGNGDGNFKAAMTIAATTAGSMQVGEFSGDGIGDLLLSSGSSSVLIVLIGNGDGSFSASTSFATQTRGILIMTAPLT